MFWRKKEQEPVRQEMVEKLDLDDSFKVAFGLVISELEGADSVSVASLFGAVRDNQGDPRKQTKALLECLHGVVWKWPTYEAYVRGQQDVIYEAAVDDIEDCEPEEIFDKFNVSRLKEMYQQCIGDPPKSSLRKSEMKKALAESSNKELLFRLRKELVAALDDPKRIDRKSMATALARRIDALAYSLHRRQQMQEIADYRPYWEFVMALDSSAPPECKSLHGTIKHYTDPFWQDYYPSCWRPDCRCRVNSHSDRSLERRGKNEH